MTLLTRRTAGVFAALRILGGGAVRASGAVVFAYHDIDDDPANATTYLATPDRLRAQLLSVISWGLSFVELGELCDRHARGESLDGLAAVSFDDGLHGVYRHALPILRELDVPATVFVGADPGSCAQPWPGSRAMTDEEVRVLADNGVTIGSHTMSHASLPGLDADALRHELHDSRTRLEALAQQPLDLLAYPYGHHDPRVRAASSRIRVPGRLHLPERPVHQSGGSAPNPATDHEWAGSRAPRIPRGTPSVVVARPSARHRPRSRRPRPGQWAEPADDRRASR